MTNLDKKIDNLKPGQSIEISNSGGVRCTVERSCNGHTIRFVRHTSKGWTVFKTQWR
jgi:hypothetical protein